MYLEDSTTMSNSSFELENKITKIEFPFHPDIRRQG
jgi:hypothetical protein